METEKIMSEITTANLFYPNQLFYDSEGISKNSLSVLIEDPLFFSQYKFHKQKLILHRASLKAFEANLQNNKIPTKYVTFDRLNKTEDIADILHEAGIKKIILHDLNDEWLSKKVYSAFEKRSMSIKEYQTPNFLTPLEFAEDFFESKKNYFFTSFYKEQRKRLNVLLDDQSNPVGGKWTFDIDNRKKLPKNHLPPEEKFHSNESSKSFINEAKDYVNKHFKNNYGNVDNFNYPISPDEARNVLSIFLEYKFKNFGTYEDAISSRFKVIYHSLLTPSLNIGLISPKDILDETLKFAKKEKIPVNSVEGFIRQIIGWREYMRIVYLREGGFQRTNNFFGFNRKIPESFWSAGTGIIPVDNTISSVIESSYCHHIERLMVLGNFMLLCEFSPDEVYEWFMSLFIDSYDWVMVPNVYGMSQYADGGKITTKPYISSSNYICKMSDYTKSQDWSEIWDSLYWRFLEKHRDALLYNSRMTMMYKQFEKMTKSKKDNFNKVSEEFLNSLN